MRDPSRCRKSTCALDIGSPVARSTIRPVMPSLIWASAGMTFTQKPMRNATAAGPPLHIFILGIVSAPPLQSVANAEPE